MAPARKHNRPAIVKAICAAISKGVLVQDACKAQKITRGQLHVWLTEDATMRDAYARARDEQAHAIAEEALTIADEAVETSEAIQRNRLRVDTRKWLASKIAPRHYGERQQVEHAGGVTVAVTYVEGDE